jgi:hypothetical protein
MNRFVYGPALADALKTIFLRNLHAFPNELWSNSSSTPPNKYINVPELVAKKYFTIRWYDDRVTSKIFGFRDGEDYYTQTSSKQYLEQDRIRVPTLSLHALDDPIVSPHYLPWEALATSRHVVFAATKGGGHVGWFQAGVKGWGIPQENQLGACELMLTVHCRLTAS